MTNDERIIESFLKLFYTGAFPLSVGAGVAICNALNIPNLPSLTMSQYQKLSIEHPYSPREIKEKVDRVNEQIQLTTRALMTNTHDS